MRQSRILTLATCKCPVRRHAACGKMMSGNLTAAELPVCDNYTSYGQYIYSNLPSSRVCREKSRITDSDSVATAHSCLRRGSIAQTRTYPVGDRRDNGPYPYIVFLFGQRTDTRSGQRPQSMAYKNDKRPPCVRIQV